MLRWEIKHSHGNGSLFSPLTVRKSPPAPEQGLLGCKHTKRETVYIAIFK